MSWVSPASAAESLFQGSQSRGNGIKHTSLHPSLTRYPGLDLLLLIGALALEVIAYSGHHHFFKDMWHSPVHSADQGECSVLHRYCQEGERTHWLSQNILIIACLLRVQNCKQPELFSWLLYLLLY